MSEAAPDASGDEWSDWLLHRRHGGDPTYEGVVRGFVDGYADRVLDGAQLCAGMTLLDVGSGDGLLALRALERIGASLRAVLTDISAPLLQHARACAERRGLVSQCAFLECSADRLEGIADASIDVVVTRASLAYVKDKRAAFGEIHRVLKPGGRLSIGEPILQDDAFLARALRRRVDEQTGEPTDQFLPLLHRWKAAQYPDTIEAYEGSPHVNYSERDLINLVRGAGFAEIHLQLHIDIAPPLSTSWEVFLASSPHPWAPSLGTILAEQFSAQERQLFERLVRPTVEAGQNFMTDRVAYLQANKSAP